MPIALQSAAFVVAGAFATEFFIGWDWLAGAAFGLLAHCAWGFFREGGHLNAGE